RNWGKHGAETAGTLPYRRRKLELKGARIRAAAEPLRENCVSLRFPVRRKTLPVHAEQSPCSGLRREPPQAIEFAGRLASARGEIGGKVEQTPCYLPCWQGTGFKRGCTLTSPP